MNSLPVCYWKCVLYFNIARDQGIDSFNHVSVEINFKVASLVFVLSLYWLCNLYWFQFWSPTNSPKTKLKMIWEGEVITFLLSVKFWYIGKKRVFWLLILIGSLSGWIRRRLECHRCNVAVPPPDQTALSAALIHHDATFRRSIPNL